MKPPCLCLSLMLLAATLPVHAATTYAPDQLKLMIPLGNYPAEGPVSKRETYKMNWDDCLARSDKLVSSAGLKSPAVRLVDAPGLRITKIWAGDGSMTISCRLRDGMELTRSLYR